MKYRKNTYVCQFYTKCWHSDNIKHSNDVISNKLVMKIMKSKDLRLDTAPKKSCYILRKLKQWNLIEVFLFLTTTLNIVKRLPTMICKDESSSKLSIIYINHARGKIELPFIFLYEKYYKIVFIWKSDQSICEHKM